jgi:hypothetical protein
MMAAESEMEKQPLLASRQMRSSNDEAEEQEASLSQLQSNVRAAQRAYFKAWSRTTSGKWHKRIMISVTTISILFMVCMMGLVISDSISDSDLPYYSPRRVALEAHIMSKCPDAKDCLHDMILPAMMNVSGMVDFKLSYIGT